MSKNILIFSDGTGQVGGLRPDQRLSNIYKLYRATRVGPDNIIDPDLQLAFYDAGLGTAETSDPLWVRPLTSARKMFASATGTGIGRNTVDCYAAILERYEPGDRIYLFGFSRGGYTVRCLANVIALCGIPTTAKDGAALPRRGAALRTIAEEAVYRVYDHASGRKNEAHLAQRDELARRFRAKYSSADQSRPDKANVAPYFIGVFESVAALGMRPWMRIAALTIATVLIFALSVAGASVLSALFDWQVRQTTGIIFAVSIALTLLRLLTWHVKYINGFPKPNSFHAHLSIMRFSRDEADTRFDDDVMFGRHALAIDERRYDFARALWGASRTDTEGAVAGVPRFRQMWFAGNHSDIGGSYPEEESRLSDIPLDWMIKQTEVLPHPILIDRSKLNLFPRADGMQHCEVEAAKELFPWWWPRALRFSWKTDIRASASGAPRHPSVDERLKLPMIQNMDRRHPYRPLALIYDLDHGEGCQMANQDCLPKGWRERWNIVLAAAGRDITSEEGSKTTD